jgi:hypothetical protein
MKRVFMKPKIFTVIIFCIFAGNLFSQPTIVNQKTIGGNGGDNLQDICLTNDGGIIVGGYSNSGISGEKTKKSRGVYDYWVVKLNKHQKIQWNKTIGGSSFDELTAVQQTSDGGYILGGFSNSKISGEKTQATRGGYDYWIVKLDSSGSIEWDKTIGGNSDDELNSLQQTSDGGYILGGYSASDVSGEKTQISRGGGYDYWIVKVDNLGNIEWDKTIGGNGYDNLHSLQQTNDGGFILGGTSTSGISGEKTQISRGIEDYWIVKVDNLGNIQWDKTIGGNSDDELYSLQQTRDGGYILGGTSYSGISGEKSQRSRGVTDYWIVKVDNVGNIQWDKTVGGNGYDNLHSLQQTNDSGFILGGASTSGLSGEKTENNEGNYDYWIVKLNENGHIQWDKTIGGNGYDNLYSINEISKNHYAMGGGSFSGISFDKTDTSRGSSDYWIVYLDYHSPGLKTGNVTSITANSIHNNFSVYPVPAKYLLHVITNGKAVVTLTDLSGKILLTNAINGSGTINVAGLAPGVYYLKNNATGSSQKVIVIK